jgi:hypothetical protein
VQVLPEVGIAGAWRVRIHHHLMQINHARELSEQWTEYIHELLQLIIHDDPTVLSTDLVEISEFRRGVPGCRRCACRGRRPRRAAARRWRRAGARSRWRPPARCRPRAAARGARRGPPRRRSPAPPPADPHAACCSRLALARSGSCSPRRRPPPPRSAGPRPDHLPTNNESPRLRCTTTSLLLLLLIERAGKRADERGALAALQLQVARYIWSWWRAEAAGRQTGHGRGAELLTGQALSIPTRLGGAGWNRAAGAARVHPPAVAAEARRGDDAFGGLGKGRGRPAAVC